MKNPVIRKLSDVRAEEKNARNQVRTKLSRIEMCADQSACRKPVWITCFFDGTGNNFDADGSGDTEIDKVKYSNVAKLYSFAHVKPKDAPRTYALYATGVGTPFAPVGDNGAGIDKATGMASAAKGQARITWMLNQLKECIDKHAPHINQINVAVFGFSRGAAQARAFVRQLRGQCQHQGDNMFWCNSGIHPAPRLVIYFLGIFDTVASVGFGGSRNERNLKVVLGPILGGALHLIDHGGHADWAGDLRVPENVWHCEHYVAAHELREKFPSDSVREDQLMPANCHETLYPGAHSDVGGGYPSVAQEGRSNELSRIPLCNMYLSAYAAGVPFKAPKTIMRSAAGPLFEIKEELRAAFKAYISFIGEADTLEQQCINHMNACYHWRWGRTERQRLRRKEAAALAARGQQPESATPDAYMTITDKEWEEDVQSIANKKTGYFQRATSTHEDAIFDAWKGTLRKSMTPQKRELFDQFFDRYVHDSVAGFKSQMSDAYLSGTEASRWSRNRQYFMGKRGEKFLYWRYEGVSPANKGTEEAAHRPLEQDPGTRTEMAKLESAQGPQATA